MRASGSTDSSSARGAAGDQHRARAIAQRRGVPGRHLRRVRLRRKCGQLLGARVVADALVVLEGPRGLPAGRGDLDRLDLGGEPSRVARGRRLQLGAQREGVDLLACELVAVGDVLRRLDHLDVGVPGQQCRVRWAARARPHRVEHEHRTARAEGRLALHQRPARTATSTRLPPASPTDELIAAHGVGDRDRAGQRRGAEAVDGDRGNGIWKARRQRGPARHVAHALVRGIHAAGGDVLDAVELDPHPLAGRHHRLAEQVINAQMRQRAGVAPDGGAHAAENESVGHWWCSFSLVGQWCELPTRRWWHTRPARCLAGRCSRAFVARGPVNRPREASHGAPARSRSPSPSRACP